MTSVKHAASFRDPDGFVFVRDGVLLRQLNERGARAFEHARSSGLIDELISKKLLVPHADVDASLAHTADAARVLRPEVVPFVSYPYEWSFHHLQEAALATLQIERMANEHGLSLKDASAYNIQWVGGRPQLIDISSLELLRNDEPWVAYRQFVMHFLAPLAIAARRDPRLLLLGRAFPDGLPLDLAASLLPWRARLRPSLALHIVLHANLEGRSAQRPGSDRQRAVGPHARTGILDSLARAVRKLRPPSKRTRWGSYHGGVSYSPSAFAHKREIVAELLSIPPPSGVVWDLGANDGTFSHLAIDGGRRVVSIDADAGAVQRHAASCSRPDCLPLWIDLADPSPSRGWAHVERASLLERGPADVVMALALTHHLALTHGIPFAQQADFFARAAPWLIIEHVPRRDPQVVDMLRGRRDPPPYSDEAFLDGMATRFDVVKSVGIAGSARSLYLFRRHGA